MPTWLPVEPRERVALPLVGPQVADVVPPPPGAAKVLASLTEARDRSAVATDSRAEASTVSASPTPVATRTAEAEPRRWHVRLAGREVAVPFLLLAVALTVAWGGSSLRASGAHRRR